MMRVRESENILCQGCQTQAYVGQSPSGTSGGMREAQCDHNSRTNSLKYKVLHGQLVHWALDLIKTLWFRKIRGSFCQICAAMLIHPMFFCSHSLFKYIWVTELCEEMNSATCTTRTWVCVCIVNLCLSRVKSKRGTTCLFLSRHGNMTPCEWCDVRTRLKNKGVNADCTGWRMIQGIRYIFVLWCSWMVPEVLADLLGQLEPAAFGAVGQTSKYQWSQKLANTLNSMQTKCLHSLVASDTAAHLQLDLKAFVPFSSVSTLVAAVTLFFFLFPF